ncbi:STM3941 family protein [Sphingobacterium puteale]|uniref:STM3941 family protein n=1 Tax=Sphingobacterium puteale TaxID=2420510 RepID=UPI003D978E8A
MQAKIFTYSKVNQRKIALLFLASGILGAVVSMYLCLWADSILLAVLVCGIFLTVLGIVAFLKLILAPKKENEAAIIIASEGITARTTPVAKAAGLIEWEDVESIKLYSRLLAMKIKNPKKYAARMTIFFVRDTFLKSWQGTIRISFVETNATYEELIDILSKYCEQNSISLNQ